MNTDAYTLQNAQDVKPGSRARFDFTSPEYTVLRVEENPPGMILHHHLTGVLVYLVDELVYVLKESGTDVA